MFESPTARRHPLQLRGAPGYGVPGGLLISVDAVPNTGPEEAAADEDTYATRNRLFFFVAPSGFLDRVLSVAPVDFSHTLIV